MSTTASMMNQALTAAVVFLGVGYILSNADQRERYFPEHFFDHSFTDSEARWLGIILIAVGLYMNSMTRFQIVNIPIPGLGQRRAAVIRPTETYSASPVNLDRFI